MSKLSLSWPAACLGGLVFLGRLIVGFPVEPLVLQQAALLEQKTGLHLHWKHASYALWHTTLHEVEVTAPGGHLVGTLDTLEFRPTSLQGASVRGQGKPYRLQATLSPSSAQVEISELPLAWVQLPPDSKLSLAESTLSAKVAWEAADQHVDARFEWHGGLHQPPLFDGPIDVTGHLETRRKAGELVLETLRGEGLRGRGRLTLSNLGSSTPVHLEGNLEAELHGLNTTLAVQGSPDNLTIAPAATPPKRGT